MYSASLTLFACLMARQSFLKTASSAQDSSFLNSLACVTQSAPMVFVIKPLNLGLAKSINRRGVTPLVLLLNRPGQSSWKSFSTLVLSSSLCRAETPLTAWLPTQAKCAIRTRLPPVSSINDMRAMRWSSPGKCLRTSSRNRELIS